MTLRRRAVTATVVVVVITVVLVLLVVRQVAAATLVALIDDDLRTTADAAPRALASGQLGPGSGLGALRPAPRGHGRGPVARADAPDGLVRVLAADGQLLATSDREVALPVSPAAARVAAARGGGGEVLETTPTDAERLRVLTRGLPGGGAVQLARSLAEVDAALDALTLRLALVGLAAALSAGLLAGAVADRVVRPVGELTRAAEEVGASHRLELRISPSGDDELARLGQAFDRMLVSLEQARAAQSQLIADASHELRTPLTSLRTNIDLLRSGVALDPDDQARLLDDLGEQLAVFAALVDGLVTLARGELPLTDPGPVAVDALVATVVEQAARDHPAAHLHLDARPAVVDGDGDRLARAVRNLVDNAVVHGGGDVEVVVRCGAHVEVEVRDRGPGIAADELELVRRRFHRGAHGRTQPGSGLGLAIVEQTAAQHGGRLELHAAPGDGTRAVLVLPPG